MALTELKVKQARGREESYKLTDGRGLYLLVRPNGGKWWRFDYRYGGKRKTLSMGVYPDVSLKKARNRLDEARLQPADGIDPGALRRAEKGAGKDTFEADPAEIGALLRAIDGYEGDHVTRCALKLAPLTFARPRASCATVDDRKSITT